MPQVRGSGTHSVIAIGQRARFQGTEVRVLADSAATAYDGGPRSVAVQYTDSLRSTIPVTVASTSLTIIAEDGVRQGTPVAHHAAGTISMRIHAEDQRHLAACARQQRAEGRICQEREDAYPAQQIQTQERNDAADARTLQEGHHPSRNTSQSLTTSTGPQQPSNVIWVQSADDLESDTVPAAILQQRGPGGVLQLDHFCIQGDAVEQRIQEHPSAARPPLQADPLVSHRSPSTGVSALGAADLLGFGIVLPPPSLTLTAKNNKN